MAGAACIAAVARAQPKKARIGMLITSSADATQHLRAAFGKRLEELGWREGTNVETIVRYAKGSSMAFDSLAAEVVGAGPDVIVAPFGPFAAVARKHTRTIPIVFSISQDPVGEGLVESLARPGGNATGVATRSQELVGKRIQLLKETLPRARRVGVVVNPDAVAAASAPLLEQLERAASSLDVQLIRVAAKPGTGYGPTFARLASERVDAVVGTVEWNYSWHEAFAREANRAGIPTVCDASEFTDAGALMSLAVSLAERYRRSADYVDRILRGARPAELPVDEPTVFELVVNLKTARMLGVSVPAPVLLRASRVIE